jgi:hypothetical protein
VLVVATPISVCVELLILFCSAGGDSYEVIPDRLLLAALTLLCCFCVGADSYKVTTSALLSPALTCNLGPLKCRYFAFLEKCTDAKACTVILRGGESTLCFMCVCAVYSDVIALSGGAVKSPLLGMIRSTCSCCPSRPLLFDTATSVPYVRSLLLFNACEAINTFAVS